MTAEEKFDGLIMTLVQQSQGIENFYNHVFSFMRRKTDFFTMPDNQVKDIILKPFNEHQKIFKEDKQREAALKKKQDEEKKKKAEEEAKKKQGESSAQVEEVTEEEAERIMQEEARKKEQASKKDESEIEGSGDVVAKAEGEEDEKEGEDKKDKGQKPLPGNGGVADKYYWQQTLEEVTAFVAVPDNVKAKDLEVKFEAEHLRIGVKGQDPIIDGKLHKKIKKGDTLWSLESDGSKRTVSITFTKYEGQCWWDCVIEGDPKIDTQKVEPENSKLSDLDGDTRGVVEKMMFDQQQKQKGLPTSEEQGKRDKLKTFMDAHPEMDFSKTKFC